jgi:hypothetical protein
MLTVNSLTPEEIQTLEEMHKNHPCHFPRIRAHAVLLNATGYISWQTLPVSIIFVGKRRQHGYMLGKTAAFVRYLMRHAVVVRVYCATKQRLTCLHLSINRQDL